MSTAQYETRVVAFVDILGFGDLVRRSDSAPELVGQIVEALERVRIARGPSEADSDFRTQNFSDSLILSAPNTAQGLWRLIFALEGLSWNLMDLGLFIRGAVVVGSIHHTDERVFGLAVNQAYDLESKVAHVPRVVVGASALKSAREFAAADDWAKDNLAQKIIRDTDGVWFVNFLFDLAEANKQKAVRDEDTLMLLDQGKRWRDMLQSKIEATVEQPSIYEKLSWVARYWNRVVSTGEYFPGDVPLDQVHLPGML